MTSISLTETQKAQIVMKRFTTLHDSQVEIFDDVQMYYQMYQSFMDESDDYPWDYQLTDPVIFQLIRNMMARLNPSDYKVRLDPTNESTESIRDLNQQLVNWELSEMGKTLVFYNMIWRGLLAGRAYIYTGWCHEPTLQIKVGEGEQATMKVMRDLVNRAYAENVRFTDMFAPNRNIPDLHLQPYLLQRMSKRFGEMLDDNETALEHGEKPEWNEEYIKKIRESKKFSTKIDYGIDLPMDEDSAGEKPNDDLFARSQYINMIRMQTLEGDVLYIPEEKECEWIMNNNTENKYWHGHYPYITWTPFPEDEEFFPQGIVQPVADLQIAISSVLNQFLTAGRMAGNPMWIKGKSANATPDWMFVNRPNGVITVNGNTDDIQQVQTKDVSNTYIQMRQDLQTTFERATSMSSLYSSGVAGGSSPQINKTARGAQVIDSNMDLPVQLLISIFGSMALSQIGRHFLELNAQYVTDAQTFKITGEKSFHKITPAEVSTSFNVVVNPDTVLKTNPVVKQAQLMNVIGTMNAEKNVALDTKPVYTALFNQMPELDEIGDQLIIDPMYQAEQAIQSIERGIVPPVTAQQDHKLIIQIVQKYVLDSQPEGEALQAIAEYLDEHRKWIAATDMNLVTMNPQVPGMIQPGVPVPPVTGVAPTGVDETGAMTGNPTADLPIPIPEDEQGLELPPLT